MKAKTHLSQTKSRGGFTLVEMLVVIGMIAALAGISFPVYRSIQKKVEKQQTQMMYASIERAVENFETEYNYLPYAGASYPAADVTIYWLNSQISEFFGILMGLESSKNFKRIKFLELPEAEGSGPGGSTARGPYGYYDGVVTSGELATLYSPSGMSYAARIDHDLDGEILCNTLQNNSNYDANVSGKKIIFWTPGAAVWDNTRDDWITSW